MLKTSIAAALLIALTACAYIHPGLPNNEPTPGSSYNPVSHEWNDNGR